MPDVTKKRTSNPNETSTQKLTRLANKRVNKAIIQIRLIGNLGAYGPSQQQVDMIIRAIDGEITAMKNNIRLTKTSGNEAFKLT